MLSMSNVTSVASAAAYYAEDNYYSQEENREMSVWAGKGAEALGLVGPVDPADFAKILAGEIGEFGLGRIVGKDADGEVLRDHRPGFDVTLSAPKSVSLLAEVAGNNEVRDAHEAAVTKVLEYMESRLAQARTTEAGETITVPTNNLIVGRFHHTTSRDLDPQTHTHLVVANATQLDDGRWRSIANELIYKHQKLLGAIYDSELAANLRGLGYRLESTQEGRWEIAGITRDQIDHFSQRSQAIEDRLEKFGLTRDTATATQREDAALRTRDPKREVDHQVLAEDWKDRAQATGVDFKRIETEREQGSAPPASDAVHSGKAQEAVRFAIAHLTERESVVPWEDVIKTALEHAVKDAPWAGVRIDDVEKSLAGRLASKEALSTIEGHISTPEALERERGMLAMLEAGRGAVKPMAHAERVAAGIVQFEEVRSQATGNTFQLTFGQVEAAQVALTSDDRFLGLQGYAGVGKTTMLELVRVVAEEAGYKVRGMAPSAMAALTLQNESGIESVTTARFLLDEGARAVEQAKPVKVDVFGAMDLNGTQWRKLSLMLPAKARTGYGSGELWIMDEASLSGQREMTELMEMANKAGARLILVGDRLQLNAVEAGKPFELLQKAGIAGAVMSDINRQQVDDLKHAVSAAVNRDNLKAFELLSERIVEIDSKGELLRRVAHDILEKHPGDREKALIIVPLNIDRHKINAMVREGLQDRGEIAADVAERKVLVPTGYTDAQKASTPYYEPAMQVRFGRAYRSLGVAGGEYGTVTRIDVPGHVVHLNMEDGRQVAWSPEKHAKVEAYKVENRQLAVGDELRFTRNNKELGLNNGTPMKVAVISDGGMVVETAKGAMTLSRSQLSHAHWDYAYAMTVYASQGRTTNDANFLITADSGAAMGERSFYVGITRPKLDMTIYTNDRGKAEELILQAQNKTSAVEAFSVKDLLGGARPDEDGKGMGGRGQAGGDRSAGAER